MEFPVAFTSFEKWNALAVQELPHPFGSQRIRCGPGHIVVDPAIAVHEDVAVLTTEWIPVHNNGTATFERMVHSPSLYMQKARAVRKQGGAYVARSTAEIKVSTPLVLVGGVANYYHWLADYLPRLLVADLFEQYSKWPLLLNKPLAPFQQESLELLGISEAARFCVEPGVTVRTPKLLVPTLMSSTTLMHSEAAGMVKDAFPPASQGSHRRVYLSRRDASTRRLLNEDALIDLLGHYGFETFLPGKMSFQSQIDLCTGAEAVVAVHGAAMANLIFCEPGTEVFEISHPLRRVTSMQALAHHGGQRHRYIDAEIAGPSLSPNPLLNDWQVDLSMLKAALDAAF
jgi:capsular polysaccharide biosynthesis protein